MSERNRTRAWTRLPVVTGAAIAACVVVYLGITLPEDAGSREAMRRWGYGSAEDVWRGHWWALVTSAFVHVEIWHIAFNLYWLWVLGRVLECSIGHLRLLVLCLSAAFVSSAAQLAWSDAMGIGFSGVGYAIFGFMWVGRRRWAEFAVVVNWNTVQLFVAWLIVCIAATVMDIWRVGNAAHVSGLAYGSALGALLTHPRARSATLAVVELLLSGSVAILLYSPWSRTWTSVRAYELHVNKEYSAAERYYLRALELGADADWVWRNLSNVYAATGNDDKRSAALDRLRGTGRQSAR